MAIGCATRDRTVSFASTFAAFLSRAYDQIRMAAISQSNVNLVGSHCGVSIGKTRFFTPKLHTSELLVFLLLHFSRLICVWGGVLFSVFFMRALKINCPLLR